MSSTRAERGSPLPIAETTVFCRRTGQRYTVAEHEQCAYCFGKTDEIETGEHGEFCDFRRTVDPPGRGYERD